MDESPSLDIKDLDTGALGLDASEIGVLETGTIFLGFSFENSGGVAVSNSPFC